MRPADKLGTIPHGAPATVSENPFLERIAKAYPRLTPAERKVADVLLASPLRFSRTSMADIGAGAGASAPSIMRFCRAIGCAGLTELKQGLVASLGQYDSAVLFHLPPRARHGVGEVLDYAEAVVRHLRGQLDSTAIETAAALISAASRIVCVGAYQLGLAALYARDGLLRQGLAAVAPSAATTSQEHPAGAAGLFFCQGMPDASMLDSITRHCREGAGAVILSDVPLASFVPSSVRLVVATAQAPEAGAGALLSHCLMTDILLACIARRAEPEPEPAPRSVSQAGEIDDHA